MGAFATKKTTRGESAVHFHLEQPVCGMKIALGVDCIEQGGSFDAGRATAVISINVCIVGYVMRLLLVRGKSYANAKGS